MRTIKHIFILLATLLWVNFVNAQQGGVIPLNPPQPVENDGKVEVLEFFAYGCIHCSDLEPKFEEWRKRQPADVKVKRVPTPFLIRGFNSVPAFYALEALGVLDKMHQKLFDALNKENIMLGNPATMNDWLAKNGVDPKKYEEVQKSFSVKPKIDYANEKMYGAYRITSTPSFVVNGRYVVTNSGGPDQLFLTIDGIVNAARGSLAGGIVSSPTPGVTVTSTSTLAPVTNKSTTKTPPAKASIKAKPATATKAVTQAATPTTTPASK